MEEHYHSKYQPRYGPFHDIKIIRLFQQQTTFLICLNQNYYEYSVHIMTISYCIKTPRLHPQRTVDLLTILDNYLGQNIIITNKID